MAAAVSPESSAAAMAAPGCQRWRDFACGCDQRAGAADERPGHGASRSRKFTASSRMPKTLAADRLGQMHTLQAFALGRACQ